MLKVIPVDIAIGVAEKNTIDDRGAAQRKEFSQNATQDLDGFQFCIVTKSTKIPSTPVALPPPEPAAYGCSSC